MSEYSRTVNESDSQGAPSTAADALASPTGADAQISDNEQSEAAPRRRRRIRPYPAASLRDVLPLAQGVVKTAGGANRVRRLTLLEQLRKSADSSATRDLLTNSGKYGATRGSFRSEFVELTPEGRQAVDPDLSDAERTRARFALAIARIAPSKLLYEALLNQRLPTAEVLRDMLVEREIPEDFAQEAAELFVLNAKDLGVLRLISGAERVVPIDQVLEELPDDRQYAATVAVPASDEEAQQPARSTQRSGTVTPLRPASVAGLDRTCFFVAPIGTDDSDERRHSDLILAQIVETAVASVDPSLSVVRADSIAEPGRITEQILAHIAGARLVVADLSFLNPNVFYELALRHAMGLPAVLVSRLSDRIPFDIADLRIVRMDMADIYTFVPQMEAYRTELASHVRQALEHPESVRTPVSDLLSANPRSRSSE